MAQQQLHQLPRCRENMQRYPACSDSLTARGGTTVQQLYKAYRFMEAQGQQNRYESKLTYAGNPLNAWGYSGNNFGYAYPADSFGHYSHRYNNAPAFRWYDLATATALAMGTYLLFR
jgi:hypothetical protein